MSEKRPYREWDECPASNCSHSFDDREPAIHIAENHTPSDFRALSPTEDLPDRPNSSAELIEP